MTLLQIYNLQVKKIVEHLAGYDSLGLNKILIDWLISKEFLNATQAQNHVSNRENSSYTWELCHLKADRSV